jgi:hypothetical protein
VWRHRHHDVHLDSMPLKDCMEDTAQAVGISSILLSELAMCGIPVASLQWPGSDPSYYCLPFKNFEIAILQSSPELASWLTQTCGTTSAPLVDDVHRDAISKITTLITDLASQASDARNA